jgi:hypothetical protein
MPSPLWEDLDVFLDTDDFALSGTVTFQSGGVHTFPGIFDDPYLNAQLGEYDMDNMKPRFLCKEVDVADVRRGDTILVFQKNKLGVVVWSKTFDILTSAQPTGDGMAVLELAPA